MRRVLFLAYHFPPVGGAGVQRSAKFVRYLPEFGYRPVVVTGPGPPQSRWTPEDVSLQLDVPPEAEVHRLSGEAPLPSRGRRGRLERWLRVEPPFARWWVQGAADVGLRVGTACDVVYASMAPYPTADAARRLAGELAVPWVADLRDPWALDEMMVYPTGLHRRLELRRMRRALATAAGIVMNTDEAARQLFDAFPELRRAVVRVIPNGYDAADFAGPPPERRDAAFRIVHTGYLHTELGQRHRRTAKVRRVLGGAKAEVDILTRSHVFLREALNRLLRMRPELRGSIELHLAGVLSQADVLAAEADFIRTCGYLPHAEAVSLLRSADLLFLPMQDLPPGTRAAIVPGKAYEYLASGRPVLAAVPDGDARDLLESCPDAFVCRPADVQCMVRVLEELVDRFRAHGRAPAQPREDARRFERRELTRQLAGLFDVLADRRSSPVS